MFTVLSNLHFAVVIVSINCQHIITNVIKNVNGNLNFLSSREPLVVFEHGSIYFLSRYLLCACRVTGTVLETGDKGTQKTKVRRLTFLW